MNPRILKKLTRKAEPIIIALGLTKGFHRVCVGVNDNENVGDRFKCDRKHWERWGGKINEYGYVTQLSGTVGYGCMSGYYEPEWDDENCWYILKSYVFDSFTDWKSYHGENDGPKNHCPHKLKRNTAAILKFGRELAAAKRQGGAA